MCILQSIKKFENKVIQIKRISKVRRISKGDIALCLPLEKKKPFALSELIEITISESLYVNNRIFTNLNINCSLKFYMFFFNLYI